MSVRKLLRPRAGKYNKDCLIANVVPSVENKKKRLRHSATL